MKNEQVRKLLETTAECGVPLHHAVGLVFRARRQSLGGFAKTVGYHRTYLYKALAGEIPAPAGLRSAVSERLGVDPWAVYGSSAAPLT